MIDPYIYSETAGGGSGCASNVAIATVNHSGRSVVTIAPSISTHSSNSVADGSSVLKVKASVASVPVYAESYTVPLQVRGFASPAVELHFSLYY